MAKCERQLSTENGILTCDQAMGHKGMHHAKNAGGRIPLTDNSKTRDGEPLMRDAPKLEAWWPQEGDNSPVKLTRG